MPKRILAVGDVHGQYQKLVTVLAKVDFKPKEDMLIFLGDYIDRGTKGVDCLLLVKKLVEKYGVIALMGNHEDMFLEYYRGEDNGWINCCSGCTDTWLELAALPAEKREELVDFIRNRPRYYRYENFIFAHAGVNPDYPVDKALKDEHSLLWIRFDFYSRYRGTDTVVVGHSPVQNIFGGGTTVPKKSDNNIWFCDTGAFMKDGYLSCVDVLSGQYWQG